MSSTPCLWSFCSGLNSSPLGQNGCHFADDIVRCIFVNVKFCILIKISLKFVPGRIQLNLRKIIFKLILVTDGCDISSEIALRWTSLNLSDDKSTLVQVMAWCRQATSHYLNQCWPRYLSPYGVTRLQWVNPTVLSHQSLAMTSLSYLLRSWGCHY